MGSSPFTRIIFPANIPMRDMHQKNKAGHWDFEITEDIDVWLELWDGSRLKIATVKEGFVTDGASVPRWSRPLFKPWDKTASPSILHDWMLGLKDLGVVTTPKVIIDLVFLLALLSNGVPELHAMIMFLAVRTRK